MNPPLLPALLLLAVQLLLLGCGGAKPAPDPAAAPPAPPSFDCGQLRPNLHASCIDGDPVMERHLDANDEAALPPGAPGYAGYVAITPCDLGVTPGDFGTRIEARLSAECDPSEASAESAGARLSFHAVAARRCAPGPRGSGARASPYWSASLALPGLPGTLYRVSVTATISRDLRASCSLTVGGEPADPLGVGEGAQLFSALSGPGPVEIVLDCSMTEGGLADTSCVGFVEGQAASAPVVDTTLSLVIEARRCANPGC